MQFVPNFFISLPAFPYLKMTYFQSKSLWWLIKHFFNEMSHWQNVKLSKFHLRECHIEKMSHGQNVTLAKLTKCYIGKMATLAKFHMAKWQHSQNVTLKMSVTK